MAMTTCSVLHTVVASKKNVFEAGNIMSATPDGIDSFIREKILSSGLEDAFYVLDSGCIAKLWRLWQKAMPRVKPFYAIKCNPNEQLVSLLAKLGAGFDVASKSELTTALQTGVSTDKIIFANPCKMPSHITYAANHGVTYTTFDSRSELVKLKKYHPRAKLLLRIRADDVHAKIPLGAKFGAEFNECKMLLEAVKELGLCLVGIAFHVGSGATQAAAFSNGVKAARGLFDQATQLGLPPLGILDIGGGFVSNGGNGADFLTVAAEINMALDEHFPPEMNVNIIAEPGRYFAEEAFTLAVNVYGTRVRMDGCQKVADYWINDGVYGSMNCLIFDHAVLSYRFIQLSKEADSDTDSSDGHSEVSRLKDAEVFKSTVFGPTCDSIDTVLKSVWLPQLECGDWIIFSRMGAYTTCAASSFNGFSIEAITTFCM